MAPSLTFKVAGAPRRVLAWFWLRLWGPRPPEGYECDGCSLSPDYFGRWKLWPACVIHDYHYREGVLGGNWHGRRTADRILRVNLERLVLDQGGARWLARLVGAAYYGRVRVWGKKSYRHWEDGEEPLSWLDRVREVWGGWEPTDEAADHAARTVLAGHAGDEE